jgi:hypothetical protein
VVEKYYIFCNLARLDIFRVPTAASKLLALAALLTLTASASAGTTLLLVACRGGGEGYGMFVPLIQAGSAELSTIGGSGAGADGGAGGAEGTRWRGGARTLRKLQALGI